MARKPKTLGQLKKERIPHGTNSLSSGDIFKQRKLYKTTYGNRRNTVDFWYKDTLYGRIDKDGNAVYPLEAYLKQFRGSDCSLYALSFVVDAYRDFVRAFVSQNKGNPTFVDEKYLFPHGMVAKKGWISANQLYHRVTELAYKRFTKTFLSDREKSKRVTSFDTFIKLFIDFLNERGTLVPFTRTGIIMQEQQRPLVFALM